MKEYIICHNKGHIVSRHKTLASTNKKMREIDTVAYSLKAADKTVDTNMWTHTEVGWLDGQEEAVQGQNHYSYMVDL